MKLVIVISLLATSIFSFASTKSVDTKVQSKITYDSSIEFLLKNINPAGTARGVVVASPSRAEPNYFYHWVRDAALVMSTVFDAAIKETNTERKEKLFSVLYDYIVRVKENQIASGFWNLGEPKYNIDGSPFTGPWGRPQHDGPGLRAITLIKFANYLLDKGETDYVAQNLYTAALPAFSPIKQDLEYVAKHWSEQGFDYWEEVMGLHFSTSMSHRTALLQGAKLARRMGDIYAANHYERVAKDVEVLINKFWSEEKGYIESTLFQTRGVWKSQLDISVVLGVHHGSNNDGFYTVEHPLVLKTAQRIEANFKGQYQINKDANSELGVAIGRYPEDTYNGYRTDGYGHAWFLGTFAMAEFNLRLANRLQKDFKLSYIPYYCELLKVKSCVSLKANPLFYKAKIINALRAKADGFFKRADKHAGQGGHMSEQMNRFSGYMEGATDLTWSYASHISALLQK